MKTGGSGALKLDKLRLSCKAKKFGDAGTGNLGVLPTHETSPCLGDDARGEYRLKQKSNNDSDDDGDL